MENEIKKTRISMIAMVLISLAVVFSFGISTVAADVYVNPNGNDSWDGSSATWVSGTVGPKLTIKNATGIVTSGGTVRIANGTYNENNISITSKTVSIIGENRDGTIINGGKTGRIFTVGGTGTFTFANLTFLNGNASTGQGGAISSYMGTALIVDNCTFINNTAGPNGGAISSNYNPLTVTNSNFINNKAGSGAGWGGAILAMGGGYSVPITIVGNNFENNIGGSGGALYISYGSATVQFNRFIGNTPNGAQIDADSFAYVNADFNWWGTNNDPSGMVTSRIPITSWLVLTPQAPANVGSGIPTSIYADLLHDNGILADPTNPDFYYHDPIFGHIPDGIPVTFAGDALGSVNPLSGFTLNGLVMTDFTGTARGVSHPSFTVDSQTVSADITVDDITPPTVTANPTGGTYNTTKNVVLTISEPGTIYYTTDGSDPKTSTTRKVYSTSVVISTSTTLRYIAVDLAGNWSTNYTQKYIIDKTAPTARASPIGGLYNVTKSITLTMSEPGTIYYTTNGATPTTASKIYTGPISITSTTTLKFLAVDKAGNKSPVYTQIYTIDKTAPKVTSTSPANGATKVSRTATISIKFSESIKASTNWSKIYMKNLTTGKLVTITTSISGNTLYIKMRLNRLPNNNYQIYIPAGSVKDNANNNLAASYTFKFKSA